MAVVLADKCIAHSFPFRKLCGTSLSADHRLYEGPQVGSLFLVKALLSHDSRVLVGRVCGGRVAVHQPRAGRNGAK